MKPKKPKLISLNKFEKELRKDPEYRKAERELKREGIKPKKPIKLFGLYCKKNDFNSEHIFSTKEQAESFRDEYYDDYSDFIVIPIYISFTKPE